MTGNRTFTRREFLKVFVATTSVTTLGACSPKIPTLPTPAVTPQLAQPSPGIVKQTIVPSSPTIQPAVEPIYPEMVLVKPGIFQMGSVDGYRIEQPVHTVTITRAFTIAKYAVTYTEYDKYSDDILKSRVQDNGRGRGQLPVSGVDWYDVVAYCNWLSEKAGLRTCYSGGGKATKCDFAADGYRLPTEAEWEYAAKGGQESRGYRYSGSDDPDEVGWYADNSGGFSHPVGQKKPNEIGIYDMSGNRWEWCWDWFDPDYYVSSPDADPTGPLKPLTADFVERSRRSGSAVEDAGTLRTAYRSADFVTYPGDNGFRLVRTA